MYSPLIEIAITTMLEAHGLNRRKAQGGFEATHVLAVGFLVDQFGFGEEAIAAAILHDTLDDTPLDPAVINTRVGPRVLALIREVTEPPKSEPWRQRKLTYIEQLRQTPHDDARAIAAADKIHNLTHLVSGFEQQGHHFARHFSASIDDMVWYQQLVHQTLLGTWSHPILEEHARRLDRFLVVATETL